MRRNPYFQGVYFFVLGEAHRLMGNFDEAVAGFEAYRDALPKLPLLLNMLAAPYAEAGRLQEARATAKDILKRNPRSSIKRVAKFRRYRYPKVLERFIASLRKAGLPE